MAAEQADVGQRPVMNFLQPSNLKEALEAAELIANSKLCPENYRGQPGDVLIAGQYGAELGVSWLQALQNIAVIGGRPSVWGDLALALVKRDPYFEYIEETFDEVTRTATCKTKSKREPNEVVRTFSWADACAAGLNTKDTYHQYRARMLQMRARGFAIRDCFPGALRGLYLTEEMLYSKPPIDVTPAKPNAEQAERDIKRGLAGLEKVLEHIPANPIPMGPIVQSAHPQGTLPWFKDAIDQQKTPDALIKVGYEIRATDPMMREALRDTFEEKLAVLQDYERQQSTT